MLITQSSLSVLATLLFVMGAKGALGLGALIALIAVQGIIVGFNQPARLALIPSLVEPPFLATAIAVNSIVFNGARFIGPAIAGVIIATQGVPAVFLANAVTYVAFLISLVLIRVPPDPPLRSRRAVFLEIAEGVRFAAGHVALGPLFLIFIASALCVRPIGELLPGLADEVFGGGAETLALLSSTMGLGAMIGGFGLAQWGGADRATLALASIGGSSVCAMLLALAPTLALALVAVALFGGILIAAGVAAQTLMQMAAPPQLRGRVMSLFGLVFRGGPAIGAVLIGSLADRAGLRPAIFAGAALMLLLWLPIWRRRAGIAAGLERPPGD
jgi:MFS family permease